MLVEGVIGNRSGVVNLVVVNVVFMVCDIVLMVFCLIMVIVVFLKLLLVIWVFSVFVVRVVLMVVLSLGVEILKLLCIDVCDVISRLLIVWMFCLLSSCMVLSMCWFLVMMCCMWWNVMLFICFCVCGRLVMDRLCSVGMFMIWVLSLYEVLCLW